MSVDAVERVIDQLTTIVDDCVRRESRLGFFAALYRKVTVRIRDDIVSGDVFDDDELMARLDVTFANRYLTAHDAYVAGSPCSDCWLVAFEAAGNRRPIIVQHLLLGINAHINLDLGAAAAEVSSGRDISELRGDFGRINQVLTALLTGVLEDVGRLSPWLALLDRVGGRTERATINFSIDIARREAWRFATELAAADDRSAAIAERDSVAEDLAQLIIHPGPLLSTANLIIKAREVKDVRRIIEVLAD